ncbi:hypothetical protein I2F27_04765 [Acinetobacter sp. B5B]|uniref:hypothetical protein n=1 Tax=Acinetobacter baretiae TaxID=2605383 RepID=UPI0018C28241|nr:hypothetical protein [Acinetobacter baretiae]MBF7682645.1 hypothetical protein [Acinetobacter baretiae]
MKFRNVIYQTKKGSATEFEFEFIDKVLFSQIPHKNFFDNNKLLLKLENPIIVYSTDSFFIEERFKKYIRNFEKPVLLHLSNESQWHASAYYKQAQVVIRTASWNIFTNNNVYTFPLGFQSGYLNTNLQFTEKKRKFNWCFCGQIKSDRKEMLKTFGDILPNFSFQNEGWLSTDSLSTPQLIEIYKESIFALCPLGNINFECFRTMEVLEYGCIPVTTEFLNRDCYKYIYGDHPFIVAKSWKEAKLEVINLINDNEALKKKQKEVSDWYFNFRIELAKDLNYIINNNIKAVTGKQFIYQKEVRSDILFKFKFIHHFFIKRVIHKFKKYITSKY